MVAMICLGVMEVALLLFAGMAGIETAAAGSAGLNPYVSAARLVIVHVHLPRLAAHLAILDVGL
jgi:hypothetical protein